MKPSDALVLVRMIRDAYPEKFLLTASLGQLWAEMLVDIDLEDAVTALRAHIAESHHVITIADIRRRVAESAVGAPDIAAAWAEVRKATRSHGRGREPAWSHPAIAAAVSAMGWDDWCTSQEEDAATWRAQFERYYKANLDTVRRAANVGQLEAARTELPLPAGLPVAQLLEAVKKP